MCGRVAPEGIAIRLTVADVFSAAAPAKTWTVLTTTRLRTWPAGYSDVLDECSPEDGHDYPPGVVKGTPILLPSNGEIDEWLFMCDTETR